MLLLISQMLWNQFSKIKRISCKAASQRLRQLQFWLLFPVGVCCPQPCGDAFRRSLPREGSRYLSLLPCLLWFWVTGQGLWPPDRFVPLKRQRQIQKYVQKIFVPARSLCRASAPAVSCPREPGITFLGSACSSGNSWRWGQGARRTGVCGARWRKPSGRYPEGFWNSCHCAVVAMDAVNTWLLLAFSWSLPGG